MTCTVTVKICELNLYSDDIELHRSDVDLYCAEGNLQQDFLP